MTAGPRIRGRELAPQRMLARWTKPDEPPRPPVPGAELVGVPLALLRDVVALQSTRALQLVGECRLPLPPTSRGT